MSPEDFESVIAAFDKVGLRYMVAGGLAVAAHGYLRFAATLDFLVPDGPDTEYSVGTALSGIGCRIPTQETFAAEILELGNTCLGESRLVAALERPGIPGTLITVTTVGSSSFEAECERAYLVEFEGAKIPFLYLESLIARRFIILQRPDRDDVHHLQWLREDRQREQTMPEDPWEAGTWEGSRRMQLRRWSSLSLAQILAGQQELHEFGYWIGASPLPSRSIDLFHKHQSTRA